MFFQQNDPVAGENYTTNRMLTEIENGFDTLYPDFTYSEVNSGYVPTKIKTSHHQFFSDPVLVALECRRSGSTIYDYSDSDNDLSASGFTSDEIKTGDWMSGGYRNNGAEAFYHLNFDGSSNLQKENLIISDDDFSIGCFFTRDDSGAEVLSSLDGIFQIEINESGYTQFTVSGGAAADTVVNTKQINDNSQHFIAARWDKSEKAILIDVDDVSVSGSGVVSSLSATSGNFYIGCDSSESNNFDGKLHSLFFDQSYVSDDNVSEIQTFIEPLGYEITNIYYDDVSGTQSTIAYNVYKTKERHPYRRYIYESYFNYQSGSGLLNSGAKI